MSDGASAASSKAPAVPDPLVGRTIGGRFKITSVIARGGMGKVYRAEQAPLGRVCAVKVLNPSYSGGSDPEFHKRFFLEASIASRLTHPNTVTIFDYGKTDDEIYYMAMEYLDGRTLHRAIRQATYFPEERAAHISRQICRALREAHALGVIHRDLKPANIYLVEHGDESDFVKVLDFGLVKHVGGEGRGEELTQTGLFMGSPKYMAPEQIRGERVDLRTDIYGLGVILYEMVTGKVPFDRPSSVHILMAHVHEAPPPLRQVNPNIVVSPALEETITRCLAKNPDQRFASMDEVLASLKAVPTAAASGTNLPPPAPSASGPHALPSPTGSGPTYTVTPAESGLKPIPPTLASPGPVSMALPRQRSASSSTSRSTVVAALLGVVFCAAGFVGYSQWRANADAATAAAAAASSKAVEAANAAAAASASAAAAKETANLIVKVRITTDPDGATVKENGVSICSSTPCDVLYADADPNRVHELTVSMPGYRSETKGIRVGDSPIIVRLVAQ